MGKSVHVKYNKQSSTVTTHSLGSQESSPTAHPTTTTQHVVRPPQVTSAIDPATTATLRLLPPPPIESPSVPVKSTLRHQPTRKKVMTKKDDFQTQATTIVEEAFHQLAQ